MTPWYKKSNIVSGIVAVLLCAVGGGVVVAPLSVLAQNLPTPADDPAFQDDLLNLGNIEPTAEDVQYLGPGGAPGTNQYATEIERRDAAAKAAADTAQKDQSAALAAAFSCNIVTNIKGCVAQIMDMAMWIAARTLWIAGVLFNITLDYTLNLNTLLEKMPIVDIGWKVLRDIANIVFIFITLWCGISITLGIGDNGKKAWGYLAQMVLVALFINFSLFIAKAVVDASNIASLHFYSLIVDTTDPVKAKQYDSGLAEAYLYGLKLSTLYNSKQIGSGALNASHSSIGTVANSSGADISFTNIILIGFFGSLFIIVTAWVFFAATIMFIYRAITLIILMMLSPLAFVGLILPGASGMAHAWWSKLWSQAFFAPLYLALAYVVVSTINAPAFQAGLLSNTMTGAPTSFAAALTGTGVNTVAVIFNFVILIGLMVACLIVAQSLGARGSDMAMAGWEKIKGGAMGAVTGAGGLGARFGLRGFGTETYRDWNARKAARLKEQAEQHPQGSKERADLMVKSANYAAAAKRVPNLSVRKLDEVIGRSGLGNTAIGSFLRAQTTGRLVEAKLGGKSTSESYEEDEARISKYKDIEYGSDASKGADKLNPLRHDEHGMQDDQHAAQRELAEAQKELKNATTQPEKDAAKAKITALKETDLSKAKKELAAAKKSKDKPRIEAAQTKLDEEKKKALDNRGAATTARKELDEAKKGGNKEKIAAAKDKYNKALQAAGGVEGTKVALEDFSEKHGAEIEQEMRRIATALARMSTEGFLNMQKNFFTIPEVMDITVLGADKYNALMASEHYTNPEKQEYTEARMERVKTQAVRMKEKNEWYLGDKKSWKKEKDEWDAEIQKVTGGLVADLEAIEKAIKVAETKIATEDKAFKEATDPGEKATHDFAHQAAEKELANLKIQRKDKEDEIKDAPLNATLPLVDADGNKILNGNALSEKPNAPKWENDELRKAMRNMNNTQEVTNYYRYARELIDIPPFVQTVKQGIWSKLRDSAEIDSFTKEKIRIDKRLYLQEASDLKFGLDPVMMKRWEEINAVASQDFRDELNDFIINNSEQEYRDTYFKGGKLNEELKVALPPELLKEFGEGGIDNDERELRQRTGSEYMKESLQNLANDEATLMSGTLRNLHWIKSELNRGLFSAFKDRDIDVKIPDIENLIHSIGNMLQGRNEVSTGNLDFTVWLANERSAKEFIPYEQMKLKHDDPELWEAIKKLAQQRDDGLGSSFKSKIEALRWLKEKGYFKGQKVESPWRKMGIHGRDEAKLSDEQFYGDLYGTTG